jgi:hypothetical protein
MYSVTWITQRQETHSVEVETSVHGDLDDALYAARGL